MGIISTELKVKSRKTFKQLLKTVNCPEDFQFFLKVYVIANLRFRKVF